ncbi:MAG: adenylate/guanylate cyclase domain-containing protein, partial [Acidimicrobiia bacterium]
MMVEGVERKLVAIVSADVAGYSRLISLDEIATVRTLTSYRETMSKLVVQHRGRVVDNPGDNALLEFPSATDAVDCVIEIQEAITKRNQDVPVDRKMEFRIGVHLGEVMVEGDRIYGEGVNVAARLEAMADVGGICV